MRDLLELLEKSSSTRKYFLSLPVDMQLKMHAFNSSIRTAEQLRRYVDLTSSVHQTYES